MNDPSIEGALVLVLWTKPYRTWFGERFGGLPADWLNRGLVTATRIAQCQLDAGIDAPFARAEVRTASWIEESTDA